MADGQRQVQTGCPTGHRTRQQRPAQIPVPRSPFHRDLCASVVADRRSEDSMAEEVAQEQPRPTAPRPVRCIVKLGAPSRPPQGLLGSLSSVPCSCSSVYSSLALVDLRSYGGVAQVERRLRTRASWRASTRRTYGRHVRSCGMPCLNLTAMAPRRRFWGWTGAGSPEIRPTRPWTRSGSRGWLGWGSTLTSSSCTAPVLFGL